MHLKRKKCAFLLPLVAYLGHIITQEGFYTEETKVRSIVDAPKPTNVGELRPFLGMVNYYGKFPPDLATTLTLPHSTACYESHVIGGGEQSRRKRLVK